MSATVEAGPAPRAAKRRERRSGRRRPVASTLLYVVLVAAALVFVVPLLWPILRSFEPASLVTAPPTGRDFT